MSKRKNESVDISTLLLKKQKKIDCFSELKLLSDIIFEIKDFKNELLNFEHGLEHIQSETTKEPNHELHKMLHNKAKIITDKLEFCGYLGDEKRNYHIIGTESAICPDDELEFVTVINTNFIVFLNNVVQNTKNKIKLLEINCFKKYKINGDFQVINVIFKNMKEYLEIDEVKALSLMNKYINKELDNYVNIIKNIRIRTNIECLYKFDTKSVLSIDIKNIGNKKDIFDVLFERIKSFFNTKCEMRIEIKGKYLSCLNFVNFIFDGTFFESKYDLYKILMDNQTIYYLFYSIDENAIYLDVYNYYYSKVRDTYRNTIETMEFDFFKNVKIFDRKLTIFKLIKIY